MWLLLSISCWICLFVKVGGDNIEDLFSHDHLTNDSYRQLSSINHIRQGAFGIQSDFKNDVSIPSSSKISNSNSGLNGCTITSCEGINLLASIRKDLEQWKLRGGIQLSDTDAAQRRGCAVGEEDGHFFGCVPGWVRVMIVNNTLYATHFGEGFGTRDGVFLVSILELLAKYGKEVPDVDFVLQPGDRAKVLKHTNPQGAKWLALMLSFAVHPDYQEVGIPDPSFWSWPEMGIPPHWHLIHNGQEGGDIAEWSKKQKSAFWRGGSNRRFGGVIRKELMSCPASAPEALKSRLDLADAMRLAAHKNQSKVAEKGGCKSACLDWVGPMHMCKHKIAVFAQGEGFTSSKQRVLACGSLPAFLSHDKMDSYYGKWLIPNKHYKPLRPSHVCDDLKNMVWWAEEHDDKAEQIGVNARRFATRVLGEEMVHTYLLQVIKEVAGLLQYRPKDAFPLVHKQLNKLNALPATVLKLEELRVKNGPKSTKALEQMIKLTPQTIAESFRDREERKGAMIEAALSYTKYAKLHMAPPHPTSAKYAHIINKNNIPSSSNTATATSTSSATNGGGNGMWKKKMKKWER